MARMQTADGGRRAASGKDSDNNNTSDVDNGYAMDTKYL